MKIKENKSNKLTAEQDVRTALLEKYKKELLYCPVLNAKQYHSLTREDKLWNLSSDELEELLNLVRTSIDETRKSFVQLTKAGAYRVHSGYKSVVEKLIELEELFKYDISLVEISEFAEFYGFNMGVVLQDFGYHRVIPRTLKEYLDQYVVSQDYAKTSFSLTFYLHLLRCNLLGKSFVDISRIERAIILALGPTGVGKTLIPSKLANCFALPWTSYNLSSCVANGYVGDNVDNAFTSLLIKAGGDMEVAKNGVVIYNEVDKLRRDPQNNNYLGTSQVQEELLNILEGESLQVAETFDRYANRVTFNNNCCIVLTGAFTGLDSIVSRRNGCNSLGFNRKDNVDNKINGYTSDDLILWGLMPEFVGRLTNLTNLESLSETDCKLILSKTKNSAFCKAKEYFHLHNVEITLTDSAVNEIAKLTVKKGLGARYISTILNRTLQSLMFKAPELSGREIRINSDDIIDLSL